MNDSKLTVEVQRGVIGIATGFRNNLNPFNSAWYCRVLLKSDPLRTSGWRVKGAIMSSNWSIQEFL